MNYSFFMMYTQKKIDSIRTTQHTIFLIQLEKNVKKVKVGCKVMEKMLNNTVSIGKIFLYQVEKESDRISI